MRVTEVTIGSRPSSWCEQVIERLLSWCERNFWLFFIAGLVLGLAVPDQMVRLEPVTLPMLAVVLFLVYLKLDMGAMLSVGKQSYHLLFLWAVRFFLFPLLGMLIFTILLPEYALGLTLLLAIPAAMSSPVVAEMIGADVTQTLFTAVIAHLLCPVSIPLIVALMGNSLGIPLTSMGRLLALLVGVPFCAALLVRWKLQGVVTRTSRYYSAFSLILILVILASTISPHADVILVGVKSNWALLAIEGILLLLLYGFSWLISSGMTISKRLSTLVSSVYLNLALLVVLCAQFFSTREILIAVLFVLPVNIFLLPLGLVVRKIQGK